MNSFYNKNHNCNNSKPQLNTRNIELNKSNSTSELLNTHLKNQRNQGLTISVSN